MERNVRNLGVFVATLAMIASVLIVPNVSAENHDLQISGSGDEGLTSYASEYGNATFEISVESLTDATHTGITITAYFADGVDPDDDPDFAGVPEVTDCSGGSPGDNITSGSTIQACISVTMAGTNASIGNTIEMMVAVVSVEDTGSEMAFSIKVSNWFIYSDDGVQAFEECNCSANMNIYTINVKNIQVDSDWNPVAFDDSVNPIVISRSTATPGWHLDSADLSWDKMEMTSTISYIPAGGAYTLEVNVTLVGEIVPASSHVGHNQVIGLGANDGTVYTLLSLEASVADNFNVSVIGSGTEHADNGCNDQVASFGWTSVIKNFGNRADSFDVSFDTSGASGWTVDGADSTFNTGSLAPKYEHDASTGKGMDTHNVGIHVPAGLSVGSSGGFTMTVTSTNGTSVTQTQSFGAVVDQCYGLSMTVDKILDSAKPGGTVDFSATITNEGNGDDTVSLMAMGNNAWSPDLSVDELTIASGAASQVVLTMTVPAVSDFGAPSGDTMIHAYSEGCGDDTSDCLHEAHVSVSATASQDFDITMSHFENNASQSSKDVEQDSTVQMKFDIANGGNGGDRVTFAFSADAPTWVQFPTDVNNTSSCALDKCLVGKGMTETISFVVAVPVDATVGDVHTFTVTATSSDGTTTSTTEFTVTVVEKGSITSGQDTETLEEEEGGLPGFGAFSAIAAIGAVLLIRRRL